MSDVVTIRVPSELHYSLHEAAEMLRALKKLGADCGPIIDDLEEMYTLAKDEQQADRIVDRRKVTRDHEPVTVQQLHARGIRVDDRDDAASLGGAAHEAHGFNVKADSTRRGLLSAHANEHTEDRQ